MSGAPYLGELEQLLLLAILQTGDDAYTVSIRRVLADRSGRRISRGACTPRSIASKPRGS